MDRLSPEPLCPVPSGMTSTSVDYSLEIDLSNSAQRARLGARRTSAPSTPPPGSQRGGGDARILAWLVLLAVVVAVLGVVAPQERGGGVAGRNRSVRSVWRR